MERHSIIDMMAKLKLHGMRAAYNEAITQAGKRGHAPEQVTIELKTLRSINAFHSASGGLLLAYMLFLLGKFRLFIGIISDQLIEFINEIVHLILGGEDLEDLPLYALEGQSIAALRFVAQDTGKFLHQGHMIPVSLQRAASSSHHLTR